MTNLSSTLALALPLALAAVAVGQPPIGTSLIGDPPDTSNWPHPAAPAANPFPRSTASSQALALRDQIAQLGKALFWEEQVSSDNTVACGTCHVPEFGGTDGRLGAVHASGAGGSFGVVPQTLNGTLPDYGFVAPPSASIDRSVTPVAAPTMIGAYLFERLFWDRRAGPALGTEADPLTPIPGFASNAALEALAVEPPLSAVEMGHEGLVWSDGSIQHKLGAARPLAMVDPTTIPPDITWIPQTFSNYDAAFDAVFGGHPVVGGALGVTRERFAMAIAHYQRTLVPDQAPIDLGTMTSAQIDGFNILKGAECLTCHSATADPTLVNGVLANPFDNLFSNGHVNQIGLLLGATQVPPRKTPTLRNVGLRVKFFSIGVVLASHTHLVRAYNTGDQQVPRNEVTGTVFDPPADAGRGGQGGRLPGERAHRSARPERAAAVRPPPALQRDRRLRRQRVRHQHAGGERAADHRQRAAAGAARH